MPSLPEHNDASFRMIANKDTHDQLVKECTTRNTPTILHVYNSSMPLCATFLSEFELWAMSSSSYSSEKIQYAKMDYTSATSFMFKFAPNQLPITVLMVGPGWARTVSGTELGEIERVAREMMVEHDRLMSQDR